MQDIQLLLAAAEEAATSGYFEDSLRADLLAARGARLRAADQGSRGGALQASEQRTLDRHLAEVDMIDNALEQVAVAEARLAADRDRTERLRSAAAASAMMLSRDPGIQVGNEARTYRPDDSQRGMSFLRDVYQAQVLRDPGAGQRLERHEQEMRVDRGRREQRAGTTANYSGLTVPQYLTDLVAPARRAGRPLADICNGHPLPPDGMTLNISRVTTGATETAQATENAAVSSTDIDDTLLTVNVRTIAGMQDVSRQSIERGTGLDALIVSDLARAYNTELDRQILNADGTSGTHLGIRSTAGIVSVAYTDGTPTAAELYPKLFDLTQQIQQGTFLGVSHLVMLPRRWWWLASQVGTSFPFLQLASAPQGAAGVVLGTGSYENGLSGVLSTIGVLLDGSIPTNLGAGTNEDVILGVSASELHLWEDANAPMLIRAEQPLANTLSVRFVVYGYTAFTAGRYPGAHGTIGGTGLVTPTF